MFATGNHDTELFSSHVAADAVTVDNYEAHGYGGLKKRMDLPKTGPSACPSVYSFSYGNVGIISLVDRGDPEGANRVMCTSCYKALDRE